MKTKLCIKPCVDGKRAVNAILKIIKSGGVYDRVANSFFLVTDLPIQDALRLTGLKGYEVEVK